MRGIFKVTVEEVEPLEDDLQTERKKIKAQIPVALGYVGSEMKDSLERHLYADWYTGYRSSVYERRTDDPRLGKSITDESNISVTNRGQTLIFDYHPSGLHANPDWSTEGGDPLIERIQNGLWRENEIIVPPRPFWNNFVEEQFDEKIMENFIHGMLPYYEVESETGKDIKTEDMESLLEAGTVYIMNQG